MTTTSEFPVPAADIKAENLIYYVDSKGLVVWTNSPFADFAEANGAPTLEGEVVGTNILRRFSGVHRARWAAIYPKLNDGTLPGYSERFSCPSPTIRRECLLQITQVIIGGEKFLRHETILDRSEADQDEPTGVVKQEGSYDGGALKVTAFLRPLEQESGDGVWTRDLGDGKTAVIIADAMGHGKVAAAAMRDFFDILATDKLTDLRQAIIDANTRFMARPGHTPGFTPFITGLLMRFDSKSSNVEIICFGHHGVVFTPTGPLEIPGGVPVGIIDDHSDWPVLRLDVIALGYRLLAYTDGIVEQFDAKGNMYGLENLAHDFSSTSSLPLSASLRSVLQKVDIWRGNALVKDDQTLLAIDISARAAG